MMDLLEEVQKSLPYEGEVVIEFNSIQKLTYVYENIRELVHNLNSIRLILNHTKHHIPLDELQIVHNREWYDLSVFSFTVHYTEERVEDFYSKTIELEHVRTMVIFSKAIIYQHNNAIHLYL